MIKVEVEGVGPLEFEDGTPPEIIQRTVKRLVGKGEPSVGSQFMRGLGLGVRDAIEGVGQLPGMAYDAVRAPLNAGIAGINAVAGTEIPSIRSAQENLGAVADTIGLPKAATRGERVRSDIGRNVAALIPSMAAGGAMINGGQLARTIGNALTTAPVSQLAGAAGAGLGGGMAREAGGGPFAETMGSLAGGVTGAALPTVAGMLGQGARALVQPYTAGGRERIIGEALLRNSSDPETLAARLAAGADDQSRRLPGAPVTAGVAARDPGLMVLENGLRGDTQSAQGVMSPATALRDVEAQRNAARLATAEALKRGGAADATARGDVVRRTLDMADDAMRARTTQMFDIARDGNPTRYAVAPVLDRAKAATAMFDPAKGGGGVPAPLQSVLDDIARMGSIGVEEAQNLRNRLGDIAGGAAVAGDRRLASAAGAVSQALEDTIDDPRWMAAVAQRRAQGQAMGRDASGAAATGAITRTDKFGAPMTTADKAMARAVSDPASARQVLEAGYKALEDARAARLPADQVEALAANVRTMRQAMRDQFADNLLRASSTTGDIADAAGNISRQLSPAQFARWWRDNRGVADVLFDGAERRTLDRLAADFAETSVTNTARARGSDTAQNLSVGNFIARLTNGVIDPQNPLAQSLGNLGPIAGWLVRAPEQAMREMLVHAMRDPKFAAELVQKAGPQSMARALLYFQQTMPERLKDSVLAASARQVPRIGLAEPRQGQGLLPGATAR